ncbi:hypothetical protein ACT4ZL_12015 [Acinetobacter baumannii]|nr:hypothetical protein [Acinetobacter baumannii]MDC5481397.1 hypothetical protein [Acinetobacter baumannii]HCA5312847.1 nucleoid-associated protein [Acinetobacter baumannii]
MSIVLQKYSSHSISVAKDAPVDKTFTGTSEDVQKYLVHIINEAVTPPKGQQQIRGQYFKFRSLSERVASNLKAIVLDKTQAVWDEKVRDNAIKLLEVEKEVQKDIQAMGKDIRKGSLLQIKCLINNEITIVLVKIDDKTYLDEEVMKLKQGLPLDTRVQKLAIIKFDDIGQDISLLLSDTNSTISRYWRSDFIVADPLRDSKTNTNSAFNAIDKLLQKKIKPKSKQDYYFIRNQLIISFRQESFNFDDLVNNIKLYEPLSEELDEKIFSNFIYDLEKLPNDSKNPFDTQFDIEPKTIKARLNNNKIMIDEHFELNVKGEVSDLKTRLGVGIDPKSNRKYVKIYSDEGYNTFEKDFPEANL